MRLNITEGALSGNFQVRIRNKNNYEVRDNSGECERLKIHLKFHWLAFTFFLINKGTK